jgi:hypothetical protein
MPRNATTFRYGFVYMPFPANHMVRACVALLAASLADCAGSLDRVDEAFVDQRKYQLYSCAELTQEAAKKTAAEAELRQLMEKSAQEPGGDLVNLVAYRTDYLMTRGELRVLAETARDKNCPPDAPAASSARAPAEQTVPARRRR